MKLRPPRLGPARGPARLLARHVAGWLTVTIAITALATLLLGFSLLLNVVMTANASAGVVTAVADRQPTDLPPTEQRTWHTWRWPLDGAPAVLRPFEPPARRWLPGHRGVDLGSAPAAEIRAAGPGVVRYAGEIAGRGVVSVDHAGGLRTTYEPVTSTVHTGQAVAGGDPIGTLAAGHAGCPAAACLHWGLLSGDTYLDPLALFGPIRVRLLPRAGSRPTAREPPLRPRSAAWRRRRPAGVSGLAANPHIEPP